MYNYILIVENSTKIRRIQMFVKNLSNKELLFKKHGAVLKLKPGVNCVDVLKWDINELKKTYGSTTLAFIGEEKQAEVEAEVEVKAEDETEVTINPTPEENPVEVEGDAGEADQADETPVAPVVEDKTDGEAVKTETEVKAPAKATTKAKAGKKSNK